MLSGGTQQGTRNDLCLRLAVRCTAPASTPQPGAGRGRAYGKAGPARSLRKAAAYGKALWESLTERRPVA